MFFHTYRSVVVHFWLSVLHPCDLQIYMYFVSPSNIFLSSFYLSRPVLALSLVIMWPKEVGSRLMFLFVSESDPASFFVTLSSTRFITAIINHFIFSLVAHSSHIRPGSNSFWRSRHSFEHLRNPRYTICLCNRCLMHFGVCWKPSINRCSCLCSRRITQTDLKLPQSNS